MAVKFRSTDELVYSKNKTMNMSSGWEDIHVEFTRPLTTVWVYDWKFEDKLFVGKGSAKCSAEDTFDEEFGLSLAENRARQRLLRKQEKFYIRSLENR